MASDPVTRLPWKRWWLPVDAEVPLTAGLLDNPEGRYARYMGYETVRLSDLADRPCVVLLGEAGMGKSTELRDETARLNDAGHTALYLDLGDEPDLFSLQNTLNAEPAYSTWLTSDGDMTVLLDSFDEAMIAIDKLVGGLTKLLTPLPRERLTLRIASRSGVWPSRLDEALNKLFPSVGHITLCPLTFADAALAAQADGLGVDTFLREIAIRDLGVLAARPQTLRMLISLSQVGPLPDNRADVYRQGVAVLAQENNRRRHEDREVDLPVKARLTLAQRLAVLTLLSGRALIREHHAHDSKDNAIVIDDLAADASERAGFVEVLQSGLFTSAPDGAVKFSHRELAEYLAGETLATMPIRTVKHLLADPLDPNRVVPQLAGTTVWTASLNAGFYQWVARFEPELLLTSNLAAAREEQRRVLGRAIAKQLATTGPARDRRYFGLRYEQMGKDFAPLLDDGHDVLVRREVSRVLYDSGCHDLDGRMVDIVEDIAHRHARDFLGDDTRLASSLIYALDSCANGQLLDRLVSVADLDDAPIHLRAELLGHLWGRSPDETLLAVATRMNATASNSPVADEVSSSMASAITNGTIGLVAIIDWLTAAGLTSVDDPSSPAAAAKDEWQAVTEAAALQFATDQSPVDRTHGAQLAQSMQSWDARTHDFFHHQAEDVHELDAAARRRLTRILLDQSTDRRDGIRLTQSGLATADDIEWLLRTLGENPTAAYVEAIQVAVNFMAAPDNQELERSARTLAGQFPTLMPFVDEVFSADRVSATAMMRAREDQRRDEAAARKAAKDFTLAALLAALDASDWHAAVKQLQRNIGEQQWHHGTSPTQAPAWIALDDNTKSVVIDKAIEFIASLPTPVSQAHADDAGFAYALLRSERPSATPLLNPDVLLEVLDVLRLLPASDHPANVLIADLSDTRPAQLETILLRALDDDSTQPHPRQLRLLGPLSTPAVKDQLYKIATGSDTSSAVVLAALNALMARDLERGVRAARHVIVRRPAERPKGSLYRLRWWQAVNACAAIINSPAAATQLNWILTFLAESADFTAHVISVIGTSSWDGQSFPTLTDDQLATLYLWAQRNLPKEPESPPHAS